MIQFIMKDFLPIKACTLAYLSITVGNIKMPSSVHLQHYVVGSVLLFLQKCFQLSQDSIWFIINMEIINYVMLYVPL